jgi:hypothetical protein
MALSAWRRLRQIALFTRRTERGGYWASVRPASFIGPEGLGEVAPLRQRSHDRTMQLGSRLFDLATRASVRKVPQSELSWVVAVRASDITRRSSGRDA